MARPPSTVLTDAELRIMRVLWERGEVTIGDVCEALEPALSRASVQTMLRILERKRYARHRTDGRTFVYRALVDDEAATGRAVDHLVERFFDKSEGALVMRLLDQVVDGAAGRRLIVDQRTVDEGAAVGTVSGVALAFEDAQHRLHARPSERRLQRFADVADRHLAALP